MLNKAGYTASRSMPKASKGNTMLPNALGPPGSALVIGFLTGTLATAFALPQHIAAQDAAQINFGEPGPQWLRESESYAIGYDPNGWDCAGAVEGEVHHPLPDQPRVLRPVPCPGDSLLPVRHVLPGIRLADLPGREPQGPSRVHRDRRPGKSQAVGILGVGRRQEHVHDLPQRGRVPGCNAGLGAADHGTGRRRRVRRQHRHAGRLLRPEVRQAQARPRATRTTPSRCSSSGPAS